MSGSRHHKALRRASDKVRARLRELADRHRGSAFYWLNGIIREESLHPTKGWRSRRVEAFEVFVDGFGELEGCIDLREGKS